MSAIFGFAHLDGRPASEEDLQAMASTPALAGADRFTFLVQGAVAFGHALVGGTPETGHEAMPEYDSISGVLLTAEARLDNRDDLLDGFRIPSADRVLVPDSRLLALCLARWGEAAPDHLYGDWSFAAWSEGERRLFLARDRVGITGLHVHHSPRLAVFSSSLSSLLAHPDVQCELDELVIARYLINPHRLRYPLSYLERAIYETAWQGVCSLAPGHTLHISHQGISPTCYWRPEDAPRVRLGSRQAYIDSFMDIYRRAVEVRLRSIRPLASTLSAGLDSGSVTALAAQALHGRGHGLTAFTSVPVFECKHLAPDTIVDEWPLAHMAAQRFPNLIHVPVRAEHAVPTDSVARAVDLLKQPVHAAGNMYWILALLEQARDRSVGGLLTGQLGNATISWAGAPHFIPRLLAHGGRWLVSPRNWLPRASLFLRHLWGNENKAQRESDQTDLYAKRLHKPVQDWLKQNQSLLLCKTDLGPPRTRRIAHILLGAINGGPIWQTFGTAFGLDILDPTADVRLLEYCMGIPEDIYSSPWGGRRMLIRSAMKGILPDAVRTGAGRGKQAADAPLRLICQHEAVDQVLKSLIDDPRVCSFIDSVRLQAASRGLQEPDASVANLLNGSESLLRGVAAGFLVKQASSRVSAPFRQQKRGPG